ncbi:hypothetical protein GCM10009557_23290 [Virgisporangium ochraceum]|uniref:Uncharacterized protein n=1 Tax=Virgisporangium ochraceum TaxID=65505 RepID=A0A8J3ZSK9_9ACTN|nr:hypothetical protein Voc01_022000 [Virgisporangium ochraceum]
MGDLGQVAAYRIGAAGQVEVVAGHGRRVRTPGLVGSRKRDVSRVRRRADTLEPDPRICRHLWLLIDVRE